MRVSRAQEQGFRALGVGKTSVRNAESTSQAALRMRRHAVAWLGVSEKLAPTLESVRT